MHDLSFNCYCSKNIKCFKNFELKVLSPRNQNTPVNTFRIFRRYKVDERFEDKAINYAVSHNVHQLTMQMGSRNLYRIPQTLLMCQSLKTLQPWRCLLPGRESFVFIGVTILHLFSSTFTNNDSTGSNECYDLLAACPNLINLGFCGCALERFKILKISGPQLLNLTTDSAGCGSIEISAPKLAFFRYKGSRLKDFPVINIPSMQYAEINAWVPKS